MMGGTGDFTNGSNICFNPAKTWYNSWFQEHHGVVFPLQQGYDGTLVGLDDIANNRISHNQHSVLMIDGSDAGEANVKDLFLMYNQKEGINKDVPNNQDDRIIVTEQARDGSQSQQVASLGSGESYIQRNWHKGKALVIKHCKVPKQSVTRSSRVLAYYKGTGELNCDDVQVRNRGLSNKCIAEKKGSLVMSWCKPLFTQRWRIDGDGRIRSITKNRCIVGKNEATKAGTKLVLGPCKDGKKYQFIISSSGRIKPKTNKQLCIGKSKTSNSLELMPCSQSYTRWNRDAFI